MNIPESPHYWLTNAHVPWSLIGSTDAAIDLRRIEPIDNIAEPLIHIDIEIQNGLIRSLQPAGSAPLDDVPTVDLKRRMVWPCFVDMHTHLDKGHIWGRSPNLKGTFDQALDLVSTDREKYWNAEDVYRRMEFSLKCSYAHGTSAIRTHIDSADGQADISLEVFKALQQEWEDRLTLQAVTLVPIDYFQTLAGEKLADQIAAVEEGVLGGLVLMSDDIATQLDRIFAMAKERRLNLDFHTDESGTPSDITLRYVAEAAIRNEFSGQVVCGHCCSLAVQSLPQAQTTIQAVKHAGVGIVSLPMCNLYLQDRDQQASKSFHQGPATPLAFMDQFVSSTPRWRGVTLLHELKYSGVPTALASDNCRDPFHAFGDHDVLEVFTQSTRIAHLDASYADWCPAVTTTPADLLDLPNHGRIGLGLPADLIIFTGRYFSELLSRSQRDRTVLRKGQAIDTALPDYADLDDLLT